MAKIYAAVDKQNGGDARSQPAIRPRSVTDLPPRAQLPCWETSAVWMGSRRGSGARAHGHDQTPVDRAVCGIESAFGGDANHYQPPCRATCRYHLCEAVDMVVPGG